MALLGKRDRVQVATLTDQGMRRTMNEDRVAEVLLGDRPVWGRGVIVADGMGGASGGERASRVVVERLSERLRDWQVQPDRLGDRFASAAQTHLTELLDGVHQRVRDEAAGDVALEGMGSTLTMLVVAGNHWILAHVGDSRAYLLRAGAIIQLTTDQVAVGGGLLHFMGCDHDPEIEVRVGPVQPDDLFVVCTDGLTKHLDEPALLRASAGERRPPVLCERLVHAANARGGRDNIGVGVLVVAPQADGRAATGGQRRVPMLLGVSAGLLLLTTFVSYRAYQQSGEERMRRRPGDALAMAPDTTPLPATPVESLPAETVPVAAAPVDSTTENPMVIPPPPMSPHDCLTWKALADSIQRSSAQASPEVRAQMAELIQRVDSNECAPPRPRRGRP